MIRLPILEINITLRKSQKLRPSKFRSMCYFCAKQKGMTNTIYYLASCDTCRKIIKSLPEKAHLEYHDIRQNPITETELDEMYQLAGSYEALFSRKAQLYKSMNLKSKSLTEADFKKYILEHYTFLSRPVFIIDGKIYIGNSPKNVAEVIKVLS